MYTTMNDPRIEPMRKPSGRIFSKPRIGAHETIDRRNPAVAILGDGGSVSKLYQGYEERRQQLDLAAFIWDALQAREHAAGEAGTGVGKSFAYLVPLILSGKSAVIAVPTNALLTQLMTKDLPALSQPGVMPRAFTYAELKGRANYVCVYKAGKFSEETSFQTREDARAWPAVSAWIKDTTDGDLGKLSIPLPMAIRQEITATSDECLGESCPAYTTCHAEAAKARAKAADIIVTNLTMLMLDLDMRAESGGMVSILPDREVCVIDEGHQLRERAASAATTETHLGNFERIRQQIENLARSADKLAQKDEITRIARIVAEAEERGEAPVLTVRPSILATWHDRLTVTETLLSDMFEYFAHRLTESKKSAQRLGDEFDVSFDALASLHGLVSTMIEQTPSQLDADDRKSWEKTAVRLAKFENDLCTCLFVSPIGQDVSHQSNTIRFASIDDKGRTTLAHAPIDIAPWLQRRLWTSSLVKPVEKSDGSYDRSVCVPVTVVVVSATIVDDSGSLGYFRETVGLSACREIVVGSPFDYRKNGVLYVPTDPRFDSSVARKQSHTWAEYLNLLTDEYERLIRISGGRAFCLFTSNATLDYVYSRLMTRGLPFPMFRQGQLPQPELIRQFKTAGNAVLFGVKSYWEGVDVQGSALSIVIISGTPFTPPDDPIYAARCDMVDRRYGGRASFQKVSIPEATIALKQAYGRGIRSATDQAAMCILDARLRYKRYGSGILAALPPSPVVGSTEDVAAFFQRIS
jgi:ATP-dependent DNA helicase DinG